MAATLAVAWVIVRVRIGAFIPVATAVRVAIAVAACVGVGLVMPRVGRAFVPAVAAFVGAGYVALLVAVREIGVADAAMVRGLAKKKG